MTRRTRGRPLQLRWPAIAGFVAVLDLTSKATARHVLAGTGEASVGAVQLRLVDNRGAAFGLGSAHPLVVTAVALVTTAGAVWLLTQADTVGQRAALAVVVGGAVGNLADRLTRGAVTDWIHISGYPPTFNLADVAIRGGALVTVVLGVRGELTARRTRRTRRRAGAVEPVDAGPQP